MDNRGSEMKTKASSAYILILNSESFLIYPRISVLDLMVCARGSMASANKSGDSGQPCLVPLPSGKKFELLPGILTRVWGEWYKALNPCRNWAEIPYLGRRSFR